MGVGDDAREGIAQLIQEGAAGAGLALLIVHAIKRDPRHMDSAISCALSIRQGTHQLAKKLTTVTWPAARSV